MKRIQDVIGGAGNLLTGPETTVNENLYLNVNGKWLETAEIPADRPRTGGFSDLSEDVEKKLLQDFADFAKDSSKARDPYLKEAVKLYQLAADFTERDRSGAEPAMKDYNFYKEIKDLNDLKSKIKQVVEDGVFALTFWVAPDMKDTAHNLLYVGAPSLLLPDKQYYGTPSEEALMPIFRRMSQNVLASFGESESDADKIIQNTIDFDHLLVPLVKSSEEKADYTATYNPVDFAKFKDQTADFGLGDLISNLAGVTPEKVSLTEPRYFDQLNKVLNEDNFAKFHDWMLLNTAIAATPYLSDQLRIMGGEFGRAITGIREASNQEKSAYRLTNNLFDEVIGIYYGDKYFGSKAREDVKKMIRTMIDVYKKRLNENSWLSKDTIKEAIVKLDAIELKIGYPDQPRKIYQEFKIDPAASLYENVRKISLLMRDDNFKDLNRDVDRTRWAMPGNLVNACYDPQVNDITFPAAILQAPFYSLEQSSSENYGGIGAVIAHEISHAFDNNGAKFDELGNMKNWWTKEDYQEFEKRCQGMIDEFNGIKFGNGTVNGKLVVSENVADQGGLSCALEAAKQDSDVDLKSFFKNWGRIWQTKDSPQLVEMLLASDVHAPGPLRANVQAQNIDDFYKTFNIVKGDGMWLDPDQRVSIW
ncbi:M13 family metallopeptidase [Xylocopilactobacillus apis]|uniref:Peptidase M13 n=1 Tax=Xylocopilactobacillus apis TaxID=2932183 RepID=A0AAU9CZM6_9LACO|nr:M13-type metalloendopeptidase [Xylocopilactobacillus apis]BDR56728.1 peptidase M13 [Xylocopilactobacillus apis]